ncbi:hypothetical protein DSO57_1012044 [Entomophthora muscae]|uniref:Uncharacterized protein n=1 Tax=Entomophthora muscae TaxID=34485 RepID=A0ACC2RKU8_9FUNG|nr:hypothetical protein DSO57_1012044 [Entomophthora muscae]
MDSKIQSSSAQGSTARQPAGRATNCQASAGWTPAMQSATTYSPGLLSAYSPPGSTWGNPGNIKFESCPNWGIKKLKFGPNWQLAMPSSR